MLRRTVRTTAGLALMAGGFALAAWAIFSLVSFGDCSSGYYVTGRECAPDTGLKIGSIFGSTVLVLTGVGLVRTWRAAAGAWGVTFCGLGGMFLWFALAPDAGGLGVQVPFLFVGALFVLMGLPGLWEALRPRTAADRRATTLHGPNGLRLTVRAPEDGGPAPIVMAANDHRRPPTL